MRAIGFAVLGVAVAACGGDTKDPYAALGDEYKKAYSAAADLIKAESDAVPKSRRIGSVVAYIRNPGLPPTININREFPDLSFVNFVCAGAQDFTMTSYGLRYTGTYHQALEKMTKEPENTISAYWKALKELRETTPIIDVPSGETNVFEACRKDVQPFVPPKGFTAVDGAPEAVAEVIAAYSAIKGLISAGEALVKSGLKVATLVERRAALKRFVSANKDNMETVLLKHFGSSEFTDARLRRMHSALALPYYRFVEMLKLSVTIQRVEIVSAAASIHADLSDFDALRQLPKALSISSQLVKVQKKLDDLADDKISVDELMIFLRVLAEDLLQVHQEIGNVKSKWRNTVSAIEKL